MTLKRINYWFTKPYPAVPRRFLTKDNIRPLDKPSTKPSEYSLALADCTRVLEYNLNIKPVELVNVMKGMGNTVRLPKKPNNPDEKHDTLLSGVSSTMIKATTPHIALLYDLKLLSYSRRSTFKIYCLT